MLDMAELCCIKCTNIFNTTDRIPRLLTECGHTICTSCLALLLKGSNNGSFQCPEDGSLCGGSGKKAEDFPKNLSLLRLLEKQKRNSREPRAANECEVHQKKFEIICIDCRKRLCSKCAIFGGHRTHDLRAEEDVITELAMRGECLEEMLQLVVDNEQMLNKQDELKAVHERCVARENELRIQIEARFQEYAEALKNKKAKLLSALSSISTSLKEKFAQIHRGPDGLGEKVKEWKGKAQDKLKTLKTEVISFDLLEKQEDKDGDILNIGGLLLEELAQLKTDLAGSDFTNLQDWTLTFNESFLTSLEQCASVSNPCDMGSKITIPEEEPFANALYDGDLLNESLSGIEGEYLASISPGKRQSLAQPSLNLSRSFLYSTDIQSH